MTTPVVLLLIQARRAGVVLNRRTDGKLGIRAPRDAVLLGRALRVHEEAVAAYLPLWLGETTILDWHTARVADPVPCRLCRHPAVLRDPHDQQPIHKACVEAHLRPAPTGGIRCPTPST